MMTSTFADSIARIRNAYKVGLNQIEVIFSKFTLNVLNILKDKGYLLDVSISEEGIKKKIVVTLKYYRKASVIKELKLISKPSRAIYVKHDKIPKKYNGFGTVIVSTSQGVMAGDQARSKNLGGQILLEAF